MAMNVLQSPSRPGLGKVSGFFWRNPGLGLFLLLLGPLMWFGIVYFGSLLSHYRQRHSGFSNGVVYGALYQRENESVFLYRGNVADVGELHC